MEENTGLSLFQPNSIHVENANQEEAEDLEDQKRRQEEIQNLLHKELDDFNYDDQSTINSSTNVSMDDRNNFNYEQKYKEADMDDQLKVLYEVRVREIKALSEHVDMLKNELVQQKESLGKKYLMAEAEKNGALISLNEAQILLVTQSEDLSKMHNDNAIQSQTINRFQQTVIALENERETLKHNNQDLLEQLTIMQKGLTTNTISDKQLQETHHAEISHLHHKLDNALTKLDRKDNEYKELEHRLREKTQEKDILMAEKSDVINKLTESLEDAQHQCRELLELVESVTQENQRLKHTANNAELIDSKRGIGLSDKTEIIKVLQKELEKSQAIQNKQLIEYKNLQKMHSDLIKNFEIAGNQLTHYKTENETILSNNEILQFNFKKQNDEIENLQETLGKYKNTQSENDILQKRLSSLQIILHEKENKNTQEHSVQVSNIMTSFCEQNELQKEEKEHLEKQLEKVNGELFDLKNKLMQYEEELITLNTKVSLETERDDLIQTLQEKADQFEKIILDNQTKIKCANIGINTDQIEDNVELLQAKYETDLIEKEIQIRLEIKNEYETKFNKIRTQASTITDACTFCENLQIQVNNIERLLKHKTDEISEINNKHAKMIENYEEKCKMYAKQPTEACLDCAQLIERLKHNDFVFNDQNNEIEKLKNQQIDDRDVLVQILEDWKAKFQQIETRNEYLNNKLAMAQQYCEELERKLMRRINGDKQLVEMLKKEAENLAIEANKNAIKDIHKLTLAQSFKIEESRKKIDHISKQTDKKIQDIKLSFAKRIKAEKAKF